MPVRFADRINELHLDVQLTKEKEGDAFIAGRVVDVGGRPIAGARVTYGSDEEKPEGEAHSVLLDREHGQPLQALHVQAADGRVLGPLDCVRVAAQSEAEG